MTIPKLPILMACALCNVIAGWLAFSSAESVSGLEEGGGLLTGPFIILAALGAIASLAGAAVIISRQSWARSLTIAASLLILPWASWSLAPGVWCLSGGCSTEPALFVFVRDAVLFSGLLLLSNLLQWTIGRR